jgi:hypothetical protein
MGHASIATTQLSERQQNRPEASPTWQGCNERAHRKRGNQRRYYPETSACLCAHHGRGGQEDRVMPSVVGMAFLVVGAGLMRFGRHASASVGSRFSALFAGTPSDRTIWLDVAGGRSHGGRRAAARRTASNPVMARTPCRAGTRAPRARHTAQEMRCRCVVRHTPMLVCVIHACDNRPCTEAIVASLRMTTIQQCRAPPGTAWRVDDVPPSCRTGDDRAEPSHAPVDRRAELALQRSKGKRVVVSGVRRGLLSVDASGMGFRRGGGGTRNVATR